MLVFVNPDLTELIGKRAKRKKTKRPWKLNVSLIKEMIFDYSDKNLFNQSVFNKSSGLFKKSKLNLIVFLFII